MFRERVDGSFLRRDGKARGDIDVAVLQASASLTSVRDRAHSALGA